MSSAMRFSMPSSMEEAPGRDVEMTLESGASVASVGKKLEKDGLIHNRYSFIIQAMIMSMRFSLERIR